MASRMSARAMWVAEHGADQSCGDRFGDDDPTHLATGGVKGTENTELAATLDNGGRSRVEGGLAFEAVLFGNRQFPTW